MSSYRTLKEQFVTVYVGLGEVPPADDADYQPNPAEDVASAAYELLEARARTIPGAIEHDGEVEIAVFELTADDVLAKNIDGQWARGIGFWGGRDITNHVDAIVEAVRQAFVDAAATEGYAGQEPRVLAVDIRTIYRQAETTRVAWRGSLKDSSTPAA